MGISLATGSGKTVIFTQLISRLKHPHRPDEAIKTLILAHRTELVQQAFNHCQQTYPNATIEIEMAAAHASGLADITIASVASIASSGRLAKFNPLDYKLILIDEAHHAVASRYLQTLDHFGVLNMDEGIEEEKPIVVGVSATMARYDGLKLGKVLDYIVYHRDYVDMIEENWLAPVVFTTVKTNVDLSRVKSGPSGDFHAGDLSKAINTNTTNEITVRSWLEKARERKSTIVFCVDMAHVHEIVAKFQEHGVNACPVTSNTNARDRMSRLDAFKRGEIPVLVNCGVFTEGTDIPNIDCVLLARPTRSRNLLVQMIGRGMRLSPGKENCHIIDMVNSTEQGIITVPTLLGLDPDEMLDGESMEDVKNRKLEKNKKPTLEVGHPESATPPPDSLVPSQLNPQIIFTHYESVFDLISDTRADRHIRRISPLAWVSIDHDIYILSTQSSTIKISPSEPSTPSSPCYNVQEICTLPPELTGGRSYIKAHPRNLFEGAESLEAAIHGADTYALNKFPRTLLIHRAKWRLKPATEGQKKLLAKFSKDLGTELTKGQAMDMITRIKHGVMGKWDKAKKEREKAKKIEKRLNDLKSRENVSVGAIATPSGKNDL